jgi:hypothetical protein
MSTLSQFPPQVNGGLGRLGVGGRVAGVSNVLFFDTFTGANGTLITARAPDIDVVGSGWVGEAGTITIQSNRAQGAPGLSRYYANVGNADTTISMDIVSDTGGGGGFFIRYQNATNHWICRLIASTGRIQIFDLFAGTLTLRAETAVVIAYPAILTVITSAATITITYNSLSASYSSTFLQTETRHGLRINNAIVDNFKVTTP